MSFGLHLIPFIVLTLQARGEAPSSGSPLLMVAGDPAYEIECDMEIEPGARAGLILFYDRQLYCGLGFDETRFVTHQYGLERGRREELGEVLTAGWRSRAATTTSAAGS